MNVELVPFPITLSGPLITGERTSGTLEMHSETCLELRASMPGGIRRMGFCNNSELTRPSPLRAQPPQGCRSESPHQANHLDQ